MVAVNSNPNKSFSDQNHVAHRYTMLLVIKMLGAYLNNLKLCYFVWL